MKLTLGIVSLLISLALVSQGQAKAAKTPTPPAEAYFMLAQQKDTFIFKLTDPQRIQEARDILSGKEKAKVHVSGILVKEPASYNPPWHYHLNPDSVSFFENNVEVCDAGITYVEEHLAEAGGAFLPGNRWCPWKSELVKEVTPAGPGLALLDNAAGRSPRLTGGFVQLGDDEKRLPRAKWDELLREMKDKLGMETVLVQALFYEDSGKHPYIVLSRGMINPEDPRYDPKMALSSEDPTDAMLTYADSHGMEVYLGLWMEEITYGKVTGKLSDLSDFLKKAARKSAAAAELAWNLYHRHPSFRGWYIPYELWNFPLRFDPERVAKQQLFNQFLGDVAAKCRGLNGRPEADGKGAKRPVAVSAFFNPWFDRPSAGPDVTREVFKAILGGIGVDTLILQDSVAAKCLGGEVLDERKRAEREEIKRKVLPEYLRAFYDAARAAGTPPQGIQIWDDVEAYETVSGGCPTPRQSDTPEAAQPFKPSNINRLKWQFDVATHDPQTGEPYVDETGRPIQLFGKFVVFDVFHYMNTVIPQGFGTDAANTPQLRAELFNAYEREFLEGGLQPSFRGLRAPSRGGSRRARLRN